MGALPLPNNENNYARTQNQVRRILVISFGGAVPQFTFLMFKIGNAAEDIIV